ncbi:hypothetical protein [Eisenbergiella tayi]|uniref:hypothetical protein n=1 Tax=Eisenbergiella tayi TaxID=1432052 RepID=UPI00307BCA40
MLEILIIPENIQRGDRILNAIYNRETEPITEYSKEQKSIRTQSGTVYKVIRPEIQYLRGHRADQIILDFAFVNSLKAEFTAILSNSCVPEVFQIIDDRNILK